MENLKKAISKIMTTGMAVDKAYADKKISAAEWLQIGYTAVLWTWIFKNLDLIKADIEAATEEGIAKMTADLQAEFDLRSDVLEEIIETALTILLGLLTLMKKTRPINAEQPAG